jgi:hypothetical protein
MEADAGLLRTHRHRRSLATSSGATSGTTVGKTATGFFGEGRPAAACTPSSLGWRKNGDKVTNTLGPLIGTE